MKRNDTGGGGELNDVPEHSRFMTTIWPLLEQTSHEDAAARLEAMTTLLRRYLPPLRAHLVLRKRIDPHRADDLLQDFVADKVLATGLVQKAVRERGKFRTFLLVSLDRFVWNRLRNEKAAKRSPGEGLSNLPIDGAMEVSGKEADVAGVFDVEWARTLLDEALGRMKKNCLSTDRVELWAVFQDRVVGPTLENSEPSPYAELAERFSFQSPAHAGNIVLTGKRMFIRLLREVIGEYATCEAEIDEEIRELRQILARAGAAGIAHG